jgi:hypothetical protein
MKPLWFLPFWNPITSGERSPAGSLDVEDLLYGGAGRSGIVQTVASERVSDSELRIRAEARQA